MKKCEKGGKGVVFCLNAGKSEKGMKEWVGVRMNGLSSLNHEQNRVLFNKVTVQVLDLQIGDPQLIIHWTYLKNIYYFISCNPLVLY